MKKLKTLLVLGIIVLMIISCSNGVSNKTSQLELSPELIEIDSVMQQRPDSAFMMLIDSSRMDKACVGATGTNYYYLLVSEALYKNDAPQLVRTELLEALYYFDSIFKANPKDETAALLSARSHYMNGVGFYENDSVIEACQQYYKALEIIEPFDCNPKFMSLTHTRLANIYSDKFLIEPAIFFYKNALEYKKHDPRSNIANTLFFIGYEFEKGEKTDSALYYYNLSLENISDTNSLLYRNVINRKAITSYMIDNDGVKATKTLKKLIASGDDFEKYDRLLGLGYIYLNEVFNDAPDIFLRTQSANHLNGFTERIRNKYPELTNDDVNYCILYLLGMKEPDIAAFMQKAYSTVSDRSRKLKKILTSDFDLTTTLRNIAIE